MRTTLSKAERNAAVLAVRAVGKLPEFGDFPGGEAYLAQKASEASTTFVSSAETRMTGRKRSRSRKLPLLIMENAPTNEVALADASVRNGTATPNFLERVAARAASAGDLDTALRLRRRAADLAPDDAVHQLALAEALTAESSEGMVHDWILGLHRGTVNSPTEEVVETYRRAHELAPGNAYILHAYAQILLAIGDVTEALAFMEMAVLKSPRTAWFMELADMYRRPDVARFDKAMDYYEKVFTKDPKNTKALAGIINAGTRGSMDWPRIWRSVRTLETRKRKSPTPYKKNPQVRELLDRLFEAENTLETADYEELVSTIAVCRAKGQELHPMLLGLVINRMQFARQFAAGFGLRRQVAQQRLEKLRSAPVKTVGQLRNLMKAMLYLGDAESALTLSEPRFWKGQGADAALQAEKMHADASLIAGDLAPYVKYSKKARSKAPLNADDRMEELIRGKRVALVGPAETGDTLGELIDSYDVVVRPRYQPTFIAENKESQGTRTDITYYSGQDLTSLYESITHAVDSGEVKVVNARPFSYAAHAHRNLPWLRFYRHDFSLSFSGGSLGIQRMAYDLLQFEPEELCVFNSDLYTGNAMFSAGWRQGETFAPYSHNNDIVVSHDVLAEFKFMQALMNTGVVTAAGRAAEVLGQTPDEYVRAVEDAGVLR